MEAARLQRLNAKLCALTTAGVDEEDTGNTNKEEEEERGAGQDARMSGSCWFAAFGLMDPLDVSPAAMHRLGLGRRVEKSAAAQKFKGKVSTHGPRASRREQWRVSKGMTPQAKSKGLNRQGSAAARYKSGRPHRRR
ncbi:hypothetical protein EI94DRAFT_1720016 [Lactarius quietus]|nr:hypothetical protein EI94DRAFT_1720016 [Lactarius quietus]